MASRQLFNGAILCNFLLENKLLFGCTMMVDLPDTMVNLPDYILDLHDTMVYLPDTMVDLSDAMVDLPDTKVDLPDIMVDLPDTGRPS